MSSRVRALCAFWLSYRPGITFKYVCNNIMQYSVINLIWKNPAYTGFVGSLQDFLFEHFYWGLNTNFRPNSSNRVIFNFLEVFHPSYKEVTAIILNVTCQLRKIDIFEH